jgi:hypothetical protein
MATRENCPECGVFLQVPDEVASGKFRCPKCQAVLLISQGGGLVSEQGPVTVAPRRPRDEEDAPARWGGAPRRDWEDEDDRPRRRRRDEEDEDWLPEVRRRRPSRSEALARVAGPAILLQVYGMFWILGGAVLPLIGAFLPDPDYPLILVLCIFGFVFSVAVGIFTLIGGIFMKRLQNWGLVLASVIVTFVAAFMVCALLVLVGVWPLVVLLNQDVQAAFNQSRE